MKGLKNKVAVIAGAAPGNIGGATAIRLAAGSEGGGGRLQRSRCLCRC